MYGAAVNNDNSKGSDRAQVIIEYSGSWSGSIYNGGSQASYEHDGAYSITFNRPENAVWVISAVIQKEDGGSGILTVSIVDMDGNVLKTSSTSTAYGVASVATTID